MTKGSAIDRLPAHVLAAYYGDARLNILACLNDVRVKTGLKPVAGEANNLSALASLKLTNCADEVRRKRMQLLRQRFPFLNPMTDPKREQPPQAPRKPHPKDPPKRWRAYEKKLREYQDEALQDQKAQQRASDLHEVSPAEIEERLRWMLQLVHHLRNALVHPNEPPATISAEVHKHLFRNLGWVYDAALRTVGTRFGLDPALNELLQRLATPPLGQQAQHDGRGGKQGRNAHKPGGKDKAKPKARPKPIETFSLAICLDPFARDDDTPSEATAVVHDFGLVLLCALFLEKGQSAELIRDFWEIGHGCAWPDPRHQAIVKELIAVYRARMPMQRLRSDESAPAITLDTLSELSRCPRVLFDALAPGDRRRFRIGNTPAEPAPDADGEADAGLTTDDPEASYLMTRRGDRFIPLTMRLIDLDPASRIRFAVNLGRYFFNVRWKSGSHFVDGRGRVRQLGRRMLGYGRLREFLDAAKPPLWAQLEANRAENTEAVEAAEQRGAAATPPLKPFIVPAEPHYHYHHDKIGICLAKSGDRAAYPDIPAIGAENTKRCHAPVAEMVPEFWLGPAQLLHLAFYLDLLRDGHARVSPDALLRRCQAGLLRLLRELSQDPPLVQGDPTTPDWRAAAQPGQRPRQRSPGPDLALAALSGPLRRPTAGHVPPAAHARPVHRLPRHPAQVRAVPAQAAAGPPRGRA